MRRTDKLISEATFHNLDEYMSAVEIYYNRRELLESVKDTKFKRVVYLATDDPSVFQEARDK